MMKLVSFILGLLLGLTCSPPLAAQTAASAHADKTAVAAGPASTTQAPDDVIRKLSDLIHGSKYTEAQRLTTGLLLAYPDDQRLIKAKALLETLAASGSANATPVNGSPSKNVTPVQPVARTLSPQLTGMDKVEYNSLIELGRQAQQTTELGQQRTLLRRFMDDSKPFVEKHPTELLLWQLRAASALSVNDISAGYEAGQRLLASDNADNDPNMQRLLLQLNLKGWLNKTNIDAKTKQDVNAAKVSWLLGFWSVSWSNGGNKQTRGGEEFQLANAIITGYQVDSAGVKCTPPDLRGTILTSGELDWECYLPPSNPGELYFFRKIGNLTSIPHWSAGRLAEMRPVPFSYGGWQLMRDDLYYPAGWQHVMSYAVANAATFTLVIPAQHYDPKSEWPRKHPVTLVFTKLRGAQNGQAEPQQVLSK